MEKKTFAFKLSDQRRSDGKWRARDGVSLAGCTWVDSEEAYRASTSWYLNDNGYWC